MPNVAEFFIDTLVRAGVTRVWGLAGDSLNAFTDALRRDGRIEWLHMRHEEAAAFAAGADAELTGELAVVAGSSGPGNLHFINGLFDANRNRVPVLAIASHIPSAEIGGGVLPGDPPAGAVPRVQRVLRARRRSIAAAVGARDRDALRRREARRRRRHGPRRPVLPGRARPQADRAHPPRAQRGRAGRVRAARRRRRAQRREEGHDPRRAPVSRTRTTRSSRSRRRCRRRSCMPSAARSTSSGRTRTTSG